MLSCNYRRALIKQSGGVFEGIGPGAPKHGAPQGPSGRLHIRFDMLLIVIRTFNVDPRVKFCVAIFPLYRALIPIGSK